MAETGILSHADRVEVLEGEIVDMAPIGSVRSGKVNCLVVRLAADGHILTSVQSSLLLGQQNQPEPGFMLLRLRDDDYACGLPTSTIALVEVVDSPLDWDGVPKLALHAGHVP